MIAMHIAKSGKNAGRWVQCEARGECPIGGIHTSSDFLKSAKSWAGKSKISDLSEKDFVNYMKAVISDRLADPGVSAESKFKNPLVSQLIEEKAREGLPPVKQVQVRLTADERDAAYADLYGHNDDQVEASIDFDFSVEEWRSFSIQSIFSNIKIPFDVTKTAGDLLRNGSNRVVIKGVPLKGKKEDLVKFMEENKLKSAV